MLVGKSVFCLMPNLDPPKILQKKKGAPPGHWRAYQNGSPQKRPRINGYCVLSDWLSDLSSVQNVPQRCAPFFCLENVAARRDRTCPRTEATVQSKKGGRIILQSSLRN